MEPRKTDVIVLSSTNYNASPIVLEKIYLADLLWWQGDDTLVVHGYEETVDFLSAPDDFLFWVNVKFGLITDILKSGNSPGGYMEIPHILGSPSTIGFFTAGRFYSYDTMIHGFENIWSKVNIWDISENFILYNWISAPKTFEGEAACKP